MLMLGCARMGETASDDSTQVQFEPNLVLGDVLLDELDHHAWKIEALVQELAADDTTHRFDTALHRQAIVWFVHLTRKNDTTWVELEVLDSLSQGLSYMCKGFDMTCEYRFVGAGLSRDGRKVYVSDISQIGEFYSVEKSIPEITRSYNSADVLFDILGEYYYSEGKLVYVPFFVEESD